MKKVLLSLIFAASVSYASDLKTVTCYTSEQCAAVAKSLEQMNANRGWSACGVISGEKTVKVVDTKNSFVGFACITTSQGGAF